MNATILPITRVKATMAWSVFVKIKGKGQLKEYVAVAHSSQEAETDVAKYLLAQGERHDAVIGSKKTLPTYLPTTQDMYHGVMR